MRRTANELSVIAGCVSVIALFAHITGVLLYSRKDLFPLSYDATIFIVVIIPILANKVGVPFMWEKRFLWSCIHLIVLHPGNLAQYCFSLPYSSLEAWSIPVPVTQFHAFVKNTSMIIWLYVLCKLRLISWNKVKRIFKKTWVIQCQLALCGSYM